MKNFLTLLFFSISTLLIDPGHALPPCGQCDANGNQIQCDESQTPGGGYGPGPGLCWTKCDCDEGRFCCPNQNNETWMCQGTRTDHQCLPAPSRGAKPKMTKFK